MTERFHNPITMSFELLERYKVLLRHNLLQQGLSEADVDKILESIQVDRGVFFSLNRTYQTGATSFRQFCQDHGLASEIPDGFPALTAHRLYAHQEEAIQSILAGQTTIVSTGTGSGKTEAFLIPILDYCLKHREPGVKALIIYPMNALANDQVRRLDKATEGTGVTCGLFTGATDELGRNTLRKNPPDILITNHVMLDWMLTRSRDLTIFEASKDSLRYIVLDEIHTYRGNKATHLRYLLARLKAHFAQPPVQIGTSATLQSDEVQGYLQSGQERLDRFIKPLLDVDAYTFIEPDYEPEAPEPARQAPLPLPDPHTDLGWTLELDNALGSANVARLIGRSVSPADRGLDDITQAGFYLDLKDNAFVRALRRRLIDDGTQSFVELVGLLCQLLPPAYPSHRAEAITKAYLSAIALANHLAGESGKPLLDFRVHLFLRDIGGYLKRCIKCHKYHSGNQEFCQDCGFPLFCVYRHDIDRCVGKVSGNRLKWELRQESDDRRDSYYVLIKTLDPEDAQHHDASLSFRDELRIRQDEIILDYDVYGRLRLQLLDVRGYRSVKSEILPLAGSTRSHEYLHNLVRSILDFQPRQSKKLLGFIDNREHASQYASVLQDDFASEYFEACLRAALAGRRIGVEDAPALLKRFLPGSDGASPLEQELIKEADLWYWRTVGEPPRRFEGHADLLQLRDPDGLTPLEREVLDVFITERAIRKAFADDMAGSRFIKFDKAYATDHKGIHCVGGQGSGDPSYPSISLGKEAQEYADFVAQHGAEGISQAIEHLVQNGWLVEGQTPDGKTHYYLDPSRIVVCLPPPVLLDYAAIRDRYLLTAAVHSSEVKDETRRQAEEDFQTGSLNFIMATPTLEMGIDIGKLQTVLMAGVPPMPSNYAQRAGRAGRGHNDQFALIVTFCSESSEHDSYYFHRPELMINGVITPPSFNPHNAEVMEKHIHAYMLAGHVDNRDALRQFHRDIEREIAQKAPAIAKLFGDRSRAEAYLRGDFRSQVLAEVSAAMSSDDRTPQQRFYNNGFFPDYSFRRDQVYLVDEKERPSLGLPAHLLTDIALSEREPEIAYYKFSPGETVFVGGSIYQVIADGCYSVVQIGDGHARSYQVLLASPQIRHAGRDKALRKYDRLQVFDRTMAFSDKQRVLGVAYAPDCRLCFVNMGCLTFDGADRFTDDRGHFNLGYEMRRQAIVLRFDSAVCADEKVYLSLAAALDRTIKDSYGLDESELRLLVDAQPNPAEIADTPGIYMILYDADGNGNVPLGRVFQKFDVVLETAYDKMLNCPGSRGQPCESGCYLCMRSYATHPFAANIDKPTALMFTGYLLGKNPFRPSIAEPEPPVGAYNLELRLERCREGYVVHAPDRSYVGELIDDQNKVIFDLLTHAVQSEFCEGMETLRIVAREDYIVQAINEGRINKNKADFARLQFNLLRFRRVDAVRE